MKDWFGWSFIDSVDLDDERLNYLFVSLICTTLGVYVGANLIVRTEAVLLMSTRVTLASLGIIALFYTFSRVLGNLGCGLIFTYGALWACVYWRDIGAYALYSFMGVSAVYCFVKLRGQAQLGLQALIGGFIGAVTILFIEQAYTSFDITSKVLAGSVHQDTLFHASIAAMIKNYGVVSTGLNGLVPISYHTLSHAFFAALSIVSHTSILDSYGVGTWTLFAPLLIFSVVASIAILDRAKALDVHRLWATTCLALVGFPYLFSKWLVWESYFISESYMISLGIFMLTLPLLLKREPSKADILLIFLGASLMTDAKGSVGLVFVSLWLCRLLVIPEERKNVSFLGVIASCVGFYFAAINSASSAADSFVNIGWLDFFTRYGSGGACVANGCNPFSAGLPLSTRLDLVVLLISFFLLHFAASFILIFIALIEGGLKLTIGSPIIVYVIASTLLGVTVIITLRIPGGSVYYFSNVAMFVSLPLLIALFSFGSQRCINRASFLLFVLFIVLLVKFPIILGSISKEKASSTQHGLIEELMSIRTNSSKSYVFRNGYTDNLMSNSPISDCAAQPFLYPAISERPWTNVIDHRGGCRYMYYGYDAYSIPSETDKDMPQPTLPDGMTVFPN